MDKVNDKAIAFAMQIFEQIYVCSSQCLAEIKDRVSTHVDRRASVQVNTRVKSTVWLLAEDLIQYQVLDAVERQATEDIDGRI